MSINLLNLLEYSLITDESEFRQYTSKTNAIVGPLLDELENNPENSQPTLFEENYPTIDQGKILYKNYTNSYRN